MDVLTYLLEQPEASLAAFVLAFFGGLFTIACMAVISR